MEPNPLPAPTVEIIDDFTKSIDYRFGEAVRIEMRPDGSCWVNGQLVLPHKQLEEGTPEGHSCDYKD